MQEDNHLHEAFLIEKPKEMQNVDSTNRTLVSSGTKSDEDIDPVSWGWLDWELYNKKWEVPWSGSILALGMIGWLVSSIATGFLIIPSFAKLSGALSMSDFTKLQKAQLFLTVQTFETIIGVGVIAICTKLWNLDPASELFKVSLAKPFETRHGWLVWALLGTILAIGVNVVISLIIMGLGQEMSGRGTIEAVLGIISSDPQIYFMLLLVVGVLAPVLEETVFRGFLLTSLTKWLPTYQAVLISSLLFGLAHFSERDFVYLTSVGTVWGFMYVRSRNLLTPMLMHSLWNSTVISLLFVLTSMGVDVTKLL